MKCHFCEAETIATLIDTPVCPECCARIIARGLRATENRSYCCTGCAIEQALKTELADHARPPA